MPPDPVSAHLHHLAMRGLAPDTTIVTRRRVLARLAQSLGKPPGDATAADLAAWRASLTVSSATTAVYVSHVRSFYAWAAAAGVTEGDPAETIPVPKTPRRLPRPIAEAELMHALEAAPRRVRPWLDLAAWGGLRAKEIALLRGENILMHADPAPLLLIATDATKGRRERMVPICDFLAAELLRAALPARGLVFTKMNGQPYSPALVSKIANQHLRDCGIPATLHQLRHRFLTQAYRVSHDVRAVQELAGHQSLSSTMIYTLHDRAEAVAAVAGLPVPEAS